MEAAARAIYDACLRLRGSLQGATRSATPTTTSGTGAAGPVVPGCASKTPTPTAPAAPLSSAMAANLAKGFSLAESVRRAKAYLSGALGAMLDLGQERGPWTTGLPCPPLAGVRGPL